jgi:hypothetical protein
MREAFDAGERKERSLQGVTAGAESFRRILGAAGLT